MNLRDLQYLVAVAELHNFSKAAMRCSVSQPTLSNQIKKLEEYLGVQLFERDNRRVVPTAIGRQIAALAATALQQTDAIREVAAVAADPLGGSFRIGAFPTLSTYLLPLLAPLVRQQLPQLTLLFSEEKTDTLAAMLTRGEIDAALLALPPPEPTFATRTVFDDEFLLAVPAAHPLAARKTITQQALADYRLLLLDEGHCLRDQALEVCQFSGAREDDMFRATSLETLRRMVSAGSGMTLMPAIAVDERDDGVRYIPFTEPRPKRQIGLCYRKTMLRIEVIDALCPLISAAYRASPAGKQ